MAHHRFEPQIYHTTIGSHEPVLHIADGDTVSTTTADAGGKDATNEPVTEMGNPQTGPFYVEAAEPGDTLAVTFDHLAPNRTIGYTRAVIAPNVLDPAYVPKFEDEVEIVDWKIDLECGTATPAGIEGPLKGLKLPVRPMVGCFGVAPPRGQAISTATSDTHGGNMDYNGFVQGVTVCLPVFVPGALFHIGDGHAIQGDGEIVGTGIEISFDVTFTVHLHKGWTIGGPRGENDSHIFTVGNARPLDEGMEIATTEMVRWLQDGFGMDARSAHVLMGQVVEYEVGNMFDPAYTMVCKMPKAVLEAVADLQSRQQQGD